MIRGIGTDIIEIVRIKTILNGDHSESFIERVFTEHEIRYCESKYRPEIHYAARFAAKEAFFKALGTGYRDGMSWKDISVKNDELGKPEIELSGKTLGNFKKKKFNHVHLSISHTKEYAVSFVVID
ncbi:MAG: holo-ACP synthase [Candidatus Aminicenantes bacterium]|nr:holo-ACP synthase [Candidatus Aminicenantes bacterium]